jgi:uncharacterized protein YdeI (YjbR/CyaY-like superfamily)
LPGRDPDREAPLILFFATPADFRRWLEKNHARERELWVGFHKRSTGRPSLTWPQSVDEALCFGWVDGLRKSVDDTCYRIRFSPRQPKSFWSPVNTRRFAALKRAGRMTEAGQAAFARRDRSQTQRYSYERAGAKLRPDEVRQFKQAPGAWEFFRSCPPSYQRVAAWFLASAKKEETRRRRLETLIAASKRQARIDDAYRKPKPR